MAKNRQSDKIKKLDVVLVLFYLLISLAGAAFFTWDGLTVHSQRQEVIVSVKNEEYVRIGLPVSERKEIVVDTDLGHNVIVIEGDQVYMTESDCKDQICVRQGAILASNQMIVCLPHKVVVEIKGVENLEVDQIAQ
ncbi:MAG: NusG domain II-containing protein [Clostridia bacterium]|nr:NusG domain II-containing protein [Clostridia bacterium]